MIARWQLLALGFSAKAIKHRVTSGRLHPVMTGVYAVGRKELTRYGWWMAAVLSCGEGAVLSHETAAALWEIRRPRRGRVHVTAATLHRVPGIVVHRGKLAARDTTTHHDIPVTSPIVTLIELATTLERNELERAINEADKRDLVDPETLRAELDNYAGRAGVKALRNTLDHHTFTLTDSELEQLFIPIALRAGLPKPLTQQWVNGFRVDFYWPELRLVVETDGLRYHRTPAEQAAGLLRDQAHAANGLTPLRFTRAQVKFDRGHVERTLSKVAARLGVA